MAKQENYRAILPIENEPQGTLSQILLLILFPVTRAFIVTNGIHAQGKERVNIDGGLMSCTHLLPGQQNWVMCELADISIYCA